MNTPTVDYSPFLPQSYMYGPIDLSFHLLDGWHWSACISSKRNTFDSFPLLDRFPLVSQLKPITWSMDLSGVTTTRQLASRLFPHFQRPLYISGQNTSVWFHISSLSNSAILSFQWVPVMLVSMEISMLIFFHVFCNDPLSFFSAIAKLGRPSIPNGDVTFPHSPTHLNCPIPTVFP